MTAPSRLVVDASVCVKWYVPEQGSNAAADILAGGAELLAPDLLVPEFANALWKKVHRGQLAPEDAQQIVETFLRDSPVAVLDSRGLVGAALTLGLRLGVPVYDALYLAATLAEDCPLVTADRRLAALTAPAGIEHPVLLLAGP